MTYLVQFSNTQTGITASVIPSGEGYAVTLRDDDSGMVFPTSIRFTNLSLAVDKAREISGV